MSRTLLLAAASGGWRRASSDGGGNRDAPVRRDGFAGAGRFRRGRRRLRPGVELVQRGLQPLLRLAVGREVAASQRLRPVVVGLRRLLDSCTCCWVSPVPEPPWRSCAGAVGVVPPP